MTTTSTHHTSAPRNSLRRRFIAWLEEFHWIHTSLGLIGNICFFVGSVFFLWESTKLAGVWLFIIGAFGMMLGSIGDKAIQLDNNAEDE